MLAWDHNAYYHRLLLRHVPRGAGLVLDVGCGAGALAAAVAARVDHVDALDADPAMVDAARHRVPENVTVTQADVMDHPLAPGSYDAVVSMSTLHHLPLAAALPRLAAALRPGGVLAAVALPRTDLPRELPLELAAVAYHHLLGAALAAAHHPLRTRMSSTHQQAVPVLDPALTTRQVHEVATGVLPGARVRRLLLWRYLLLWQKPRSDWVPAQGRPPRR